MLACCTTVKTEVPVEFLGGRELNVNVVHILVEQGMVCQQLSGQEQVVVQFLLTAQRRVVQQRVLGMVRHIAPVMLKN